MAKTELNKEFTITCPRCDGVGWVSSNNTVLQQELEDNVINSPTTSTCTKDVAFKVTSLEDLLRLIQKLDDSKPRYAVIDLEEEKIYTVKAGSLHREFLDAMLKGAVIKEKEMDSKTCGNCDFLAEYLVNGKMIMHCLHYDKRTTKNETCDYWTEVQLSF
jgi:hypothetical protein